MSARKIALSVAALAVLVPPLGWSEDAGAAESRLQLRQMDLGIERRALDRERLDLFQERSRTNAQERALYRQLKRNERTARRNEPVPTDPVSQRLYQHFPPLGHAGDEIAIQADRLDPPRPSGLPYLSGTHATQPYDHISRNTR